MGDSLVEMNNNSPKNLDCKFAAETLEYLYGEIGGERKNVFQKHLDNCAECADLIEDFSAVRFSIKDWKAAEFDKLATPAIQIPYEIPALKTVVTEQSGSWFESVRNYFSLSPVLSGAAAVLLIALFFALGIFVFNNNSDDLIADSNQKPNLNAKSSEMPKSAVLAEKEESKSQPETADPKTIDTVEVQKQKSEVSVPVRVDSRPNTKQKIQPVKSTEKQTPNADLINDTKNAKTVPAKNKPRLNELPEEVEDNSLRLADLFAELETKE